MSEIDCSCTDELVCPYCGHTHRDSWELDEGDTNFECEKCEKHFSYTSVMERTFTSHKVACLNGAEHQFVRHQFVRIPSDYKNKIPYRCTECGKTEWRAETYDPI